MHKPHRLRIHKDCYQPSAVRNQLTANNIVIGKWCVCDHVIAIGRIVIALCRQGIALSPRRCLHDDNDDGGDENDGDDDVAVDGDIDHGGTMPIRFIH